MEKTVVFRGKTITYTLTYKTVKNVNMRIKQGGKVFVSANPAVPQTFIDSFVLANAAHILKLQEAAAASEKKQYFTEKEIKEFIVSFCEKVYPYFAARGVKYPEIKFRKMTSKWGSCTPAKQLLKFNTNLMFAPPECVEYVVWHEFTHFLQANHSKAFYAELEKVCPNWKTCRKKLKNVSY